MILDKLTGNYLCVKAVTSEGYPMEDKCKNIKVSKQTIFKLCT